MKKIIAFTFAALFFTGMAIGQHNNNGSGHCGNCPHHRQATQCQTPTVNADGIDMAIVKAFPNVKSINKAEKWTEVYDGNKKLLGYAVYSKPASDGIKGYNGETPVLIALNTKKVITGVYLLSNSETPNYEKRVSAAGFYNSWNGLTIKEAKKKKVDTISGATFTSRAVAQSVQAALETL